MRAPPLSGGWISRENETLPLRGDTMILRELLACVPLTGGSPDLDMEISSISPARLLVLSAMPAIPPAPSSIAFVIAPIESAISDIEFLRLSVR